ncbi:MAG: GNAT family N-acetyltransferase [Ignavibacteriae bacterium]|nr:GNAT family N-acetyltransferase [Ignavibacteriota bacterium]MCB9215797.1 GNAT family N-acetyltransferase [Ignavibacteria bacterium]
MDNVVEQITIRPIQDDDSMEELTTLLHRAYKRLGDMGLRYFATHQTVEQTRRRVEQGECFVAVQDGKLIGTIALYTVPGKESPETYRREDTGWFGQFGINPEAQENGLGNRMLRFIEEHAIDRGLRFLALDTSEKATHLIEWYQRHGYQIVEETEWNVTNYRSVVMSKELKSSAE